MIRGERWTVEGGVYASKPRPALIVGGDLREGDEGPAVIYRRGDLPRISPRRSGSARVFDHYLDRVASAR